MKVAIIDQLERVALVVETVTARAQRYWSLAA
jgi:hypothetical protein